MEEEAAPGLIVPPTPLEIVERVVQAFQSRNWNSFLPALVATVIGLLLSTRLITGIQAEDFKNESDEGSQPPSIPYWIPLFGHLFAFLRDPIGFIAECKEEYHYGLYSVRIGWQNRTIIYSPALIKQLRVGEDSGLDDKSTQARFMRSAFELPSKDEASYETVLPEVDRVLRDYLENGEAKLIKDTITRLERYLPNLVTFMGSVIDQEPWERVSGTILLEDGKTVETGLVALTQTFLTHTTTSLLLAPSLLTQTPDIGPLALTLPSQLIALLERPRLLAPRQRAVLRSLTDHLQPFLDALYAPELDDLSNAVYDDLDTANSPFLAILTSAAVKGTSPSTQTSLLLYLLTRSIIPHTIAPWSILQLLTPNTPQSALLAEARETVAAKVSVTQDAGIGSIKPPPDVTITTGTASVLSTVVAGTTMLYARGWNEFEAQRDLTVSESSDAATMQLPSSSASSSAVAAAAAAATAVVAETKNEEKGAAPSEGQAPAGTKWRFRKGQRLIAAHWLAGEGDEAWDRGEGGREHAVALALERLGIFHLPQLSGMYAALYPAFIAGLLRLYEIEPADPVGWKKGWKIPEAMFAPGVALPTADVRVRIRRRDDFGEKKAE